MTGLPEGSWTEVTLTALSFVQDEMSGVMAREQIRTKAVSIKELRAGQTIVVLRPLRRSEHVRYEASFMP
jgi:hypothetical protein